MSEDIQLNLPQVRLDAMREHADGFDRKHPDTGSELLKFFPDGRWDSTTSYFTTRQLEHIRAGLIEMGMPPLKAMKYLPMNTESDPGDETFTAEYEKMVGQPAISKDMQGINYSSGVEISTASIPFFSITENYKYTLQEARAALRAGRPLSARRAIACRRALEQKLDSIAFLGDTASGMKGLLKLTGTETYSTPNGGGGAKGWDTKTPTEILLDMNAAVSQIVVDSLEVEVPDTMLLPISRYEYIGSLRVGDGTSDTVLSYFKRNTPHITTVDMLNQLESNGGWSGKRMVVFKKDPTKLELVVSVPFEQLPPDVDPTVTTTLCHVRTAGVVLHRAKSVIYGDQI